MKIIACAKQIVAKKELKCSDCIYSKNTGDGEKVCTLFKYSYLPRFVDNSYINTIYCRSNFNLCGPYADFFKKKK